MFEIRAIRKIFCVTILVFVSIIFSTSLRDAAAKENKYWRILRPNDKSVKAQMFMGLCVAYNLNRSMFMAAIPRSHPSYAESGDLEYSEEIVISFKNNDVDHYDIPDALKYAIFMFDNEHLISLTGC